MSGPKYVFCKSCQIPYPICSTRWFLCPGCIVSLRGGLDIGIFETEIDPNPRHKMVAVHPDRHSELIQAIPVTGQFIEVIDGQEQVTLSVPSKGGDSVFSLRVVEVPWMSRNVAVIYRNGEPELQLVNIGRKA